MLCHTSLFIFSLCRHVTFYKTLTSLSTVFIKAQVGLLQLLKWPCRTSFFTHVEPFQWDTLQSRRWLQYMNRIVCGRVAVTVEDYLEPRINRTWLVNSNKYKLIPAQTVILNNSYFPRTIVDWNKTPATSHALLWTGIRPQPVLLVKLTPCYTDTTLLICSFSERHPPPLPVDDARVEHLQ